MRLVSVATQISAENPYIRNDCAHRDPINNSATHERRNGFRGRSSDVMRVDVRGELFGRFPLIDWLKLISIRCWASQFNYLDASFVDSSLINTNSLWALFYDNKLNFNYFESRRLDAVSTALPLTTHFKQLPWCFPPDFLLTDTKALDESCEWKHFHCNHFIWAQGKSRAN